MSAKQQERSSQKLWLGPYAKCNDREFKAGVTWLAHHSPILMHAPQMLNSNPSPQVFIHSKMIEINLRRSKQVKRAGWGKKDCKELKDILYKMLSLHRYRVVMDDVMVKRRDSYRGDDSDGPNQQSTQQTITRLWILIGGSWRVDFLWYRYQEARSSDNELWALVCCSQIFVIFFIF